MKTIIVHVRRSCALSSRVLIRTDPIHDLDTAAPTAVSTTAMHYSFSCVAVLRRDMEVVYSISNRNLEVEVYFVRPQVGHMSDVGWHSLIFLSLCFPPASRKGGICCSAIVVTRIVSVNTTCFFLLQYFLLLFSSFLSMPWRALISSFASESTRGVAKRLSPNAAPLPLL